MSLRNSEYYEALIRMASSDRLGWDTVALAGRGITAYAAAQRWMITEGKVSVDPLRLADLVIEFGMAVEQLPDLWERYAQGAIPDSQFQASLEAIVEQLESWPDPQSS
ncbi:hypothetical protein ACWEWI_03460 [Streptomyces sp. NPDC003753]